MRKSRHITKGSKLFVVASKCGTELTKPMIYTSFRSAYKAMITDAEETMLDWYYCENGFEENENHSAALMKAKKDYEFWSDKDCCICENDSYCEWSIFECEVK